jgi:hypothetical protein
LLHQTAQSIADLRERNGLPAIDDPLPDQPDNVFRRIQQMLLAPRRPERVRFEPNETMKR